MTGIARKLAAGARRVNVRGGALASIIAAAFMLIVVATGAGVIAAPILASGASNPDPPAQPQPAPPYKHRHLPTPAPTPMALPPEVKAKVPAYKPGPIPFHDGEQLIYQASWVGIPGAQARRRRVSSSTTGQKILRDGSGKSGSRPSRLRMCSTRCATTCGRAWPVTRSTAAVFIWSNTKNRGSITTT